MALFGRLTGAEFLSFAGRMYGLDRTTAAKRAAELLDFMQLADQPKKLVTDYSHGMQKKLALAAAVIHGPKVLFLDEPFEGVDAIAAGTLKSMLQGMIARGATIFLTSHVLEIVERLCSHVAIIHQGRLVAQGSLEELRAGVEAQTPAIRRRREVHTTLRREADAGTDLPAHRRRRSPHRAGAVVAGMRSHDRNERPHQPELHHRAPTRRHRLNCAGACSSTACAASAAKWNCSRASSSPPRSPSADSAVSPRHGRRSPICCVSQGKPEYLAALVVAHLFFWQVFPIMATAFTNNPDSGDLLRFPLNYSSYFLMRLAYGFFDPASALGSLWSFGILLGVSFAKPVLFPWTLVVLLTFAALQSAVDADDLRLGGALAGAAPHPRDHGHSVCSADAELSVDRATDRHFEKAAPSAAAILQRYVEILAPVQGMLPPGLAADAIAQAVYSQFMVGLQFSALLCAVVLADWLLPACAPAGAVSRREFERSRRLRPSAPPKDRSLRLGWNLPGFSAPVAAVFEKEIRYLLRSGPMLITLIMPIFVLVIFRLGAMNPGAALVDSSARTPDMAFPCAAAYTLLMLTNLAYNSFGGDAGGMQFFYASPVRFREIVLAKNLTHAGILAVEITCGMDAVSFLYGPPALDVTIASLAGLLFAAPLNFSAGNLLSIYSPKKLDYLLIRPPARLADDSADQPGRATFCRGRGGAAFWIARSTEISGSRR